MLKQFIPWIILIVGVWFIFEAIRTIVSDFYDFSISPVFTFLLGLVIVSFAGLLGRKLPWV